MSILHHHRRGFLLSLVVWAAITIIARYTFRVESYSYSTILGLASGLGIIAAIWLTYGIFFRLK